MRVWLELLIIRLSRVFRGSHSVIWYVYTFTESLGGTLRRYEVQIDLILNRNQIKSVAS